MLRIFNRALLLFISLLSSLIISGECYAVGPNYKPKHPVEFAKPWPEIFDHKKHMTRFREMNVSCTECHTFSVKTTSSDPLNEGVKKDF